MLKMIVSSLVMVLLAFAAAAKPPGGPLKNCTATLEEGVDFASKCVLAHGTTVRCSGGAPLCCAQDANGEVCVRNPSGIILGKTVPVKPEHSVPAQSADKPKEK